jgi:hypothetical protein
MTQPMPDCPGDPVSVLSTREGGPSGGKISCGLEETDLLYSGETDGK